MLAKLLLEALPAGRRCSSSLPCAVSAGESVRVLQNIACLKSMCLICPRVFRSSVFQSVTTTICHRDPAAVAVPGTPRGRTHP